MFRKAIPCILCAALSALAPDPYACLRFLEGAWKGDAAGDPGKGEGGFTFQGELGGKVLVRRNWAAFPPKDGRPAVRHEDLTTVYRDGDRIRALYLDNEGHAIRYVAEELPGGKGVVFTSEPQPGPAFRLTYTILGPDRVNVAFAVAPPGRPQDFHTHVAGDCVRVKP
jgi:hypothetical protein